MRATFVPSSLLSSIVVAILTACDGLPKGPVQTAPSAPDTRQRAPLPAAPASSPTATAIKPGALAEALRPDSVLLAPFVPAGYRLAYSVAGNLNRDNWADRVAVLDSVSTDSSYAENGESSPAAFANRPLLLLLGQPDGHYALAARNDHVVQCLDCSGAMGVTRFSK